MFRGVELVYAAGERVTAGAGQHVCAAVPADVVYGLELVGDFGDGGGNDGSVLEKKLRQFWVGRPW